jgi:hypothetical protein
LIRACSFEISSLFRANSSEASAFEWCDLLCGFELLWRSSAAASKGANGRGGLGKGANGGAGAEIFTDWLAAWGWTSFPGGAIGAIATSGTSTFWGGRDGGERGGLGKGANGGAGAEISTDWLALAASTGFSGGAIASDATVAGVISFDCFAGGIAETSSLCGQTWRTKLFTLVSIGLLV